MVAYLMLAFLVGGVCGIAGMAVMASNPKRDLMNENLLLSKRLNFLEKEAVGKRYEPVKDPRPHVHSLVQ